jgi:glycolate oxidase iron-sulfur subunit
VASSVKSPEAEAPTNATATTTITAPASPLKRALVAKLDYDQLTNCMRCGFCLPACPTFKETGIEAESPRGRIALMKATVDGLMEPDVQFEEQMNHCLGCRACEPACPADVKYGQLIEQARDAIEDHTVQHRPWIRGVRKLVFKQLFPHQSRMKMLGKSLRFYQRSGTQAVIRKLGVVKLFSKHLYAMERILPEASNKGVIDVLGTRIPARGEKIATVGMFRGCLMDTLFTPTNENTVRLLSEAGFEVIIPASQNCCGALHAHSGESDGARELAKKNIQAFKEAGVDYIVSNAGGCGAILVEYDHLLHNEPEWKEDAVWFAKRVVDVCDIVFQKGRPLKFAEQDQSKVQSSHPVRVTYQDSCHLKNVMRGGNSPRQLLRSMPQVDYVELQDAGSCCGSAGIYNLTQPAMANQILEHKMVNVKRTEAHILIASNPGCLLQMKLGIDQHHQSNQMKAMHIVDFLAERLEA